MILKSLITNDRRWTVYPTEAAASVAAATLQASDEDGWTYKVVVDPAGTGKALIAVYDEDDLFIANMI